MFCKNKKTSFFNIVPLTELIGDQSRFVKAGSKVALHCIVRGTLDPPQYIIWYRDKTQISDDNIMGWYTQLDRNIFGNGGDNQNTVNLQFYGSLFYMIKFFFLFLFNV